MTDYKWKPGSRYSIKAQDAGEELERISEKNGKLTPQNIVDESRPTKAVLHPAFEWNDSKAAESWRRHQARNLTDNLVTVHVLEENMPATPIRAFVNIQERYEPMLKVIANKDLTKQMLQNACREMNCFRIKYKNLKELTSIMNSIDEFLETEKEIS